MPRCVGQVPNKCGDIKSGVTATPADTWMSMPPSQQPSAQGLLQRVGLHGLMYVIRFTAITHVYSVRYLSVRFRRGQSYAISSVSRRVLGRLPAEAAPSECVPLKTGKLILCAAGVNQRTFHPCPARSQNASSRSVITFAEFAPATHFPSELGSPTRSAL